MCNILKAAHRRAKRIKKKIKNLGLAVMARKCIYRLLFMSDSLSSFWSHSAQFAKFPMLRFSKVYCYHNFYPISTKFYGKCGNQGVIPAINVFGDQPHHNFLFQVESFVNAGPYGAAKCQDATPTLFHPISAKPCEDIGYHGGT